MLSGFLAYTSLENKRQRQSASHRAPAFQEPSPREQPRTALEEPGAGNGAAGGPGPQPRLADRHAEREGAPSQGPLLSPPGPPAPSPGSRHSPEHRLAGTLSPQELAPLPQGRTALSTAAAALPPESAPLCPAPPRGPRPCGAQPARGARHRGHLPANGQGQSREAGRRQAERRGGTTGVAEVPGLAAHAPG